jgi:tripartite-type tricarboxylate transporter receptor subunit TctC
MVAVGEKIMTRSRTAGLLHAAAGISAWLGGASVATAQEGWPRQNVKVITTHAVGTGIDLTARLYAEGFARRWGKAVVVENRPGSDGITAATSFVAARDEYALLLSIGAPFTTAPLTHDKLPYDPSADFTPIALTGEQFLAVGAAASLAVATLRELEARARGEPGKLLWASTPGLPQIAFTSFLRRAGIDMPRLTYRDASTPLTDLGEGRLHVYVAGMASVRPPVEAGKARFLAVLSSIRFPGAPEVPTVAEAGYSHMTSLGLNGLFGWKGMPSDLRERISADVKAIAADPIIGARLEPMGLTLRHADGFELTTLLSDQARAAAEALGKAR